MNLTTFIIVGAVIGGIIGFAYKDNFVYEFSFMISLTDIWPKKNLIRLLI